MPSLWQKSPSDVLDYSWVWSAWLAEGEVIVTSTVTVETGLTLDNDSNDTTSATAWISGGSVGETYQVNNQIVTDQGRTVERAIQIRVTDLL